MMKDLSSAVRCAIAICLSLTLAGPAAAITTHSGVVCKTAGTADSGSINWSQFGTDNGTGTVQAIVCPIVRVQEPGSNGFAVYLDGYVPAARTTTCTLYSFDFAGRLLGSAFMSTTGPSTFDQKLVLPLSQVPPWSAQSVRCSLPPGGVLFDVEPFYP